MAGILTIRGNLETGACALTHTHRTPSEDEGRGQGDASTNQGPLKTASQLQQLARGREQFLLQSLQKEPVLRTF